MRRGKHVRRAVSLDELADLDVIGPAPGVDPEARSAVLQSLERLDEGEQSLAIMLFVDGLSQGEAAAEMGVSRVTINKRAQDIRARLRLSHSSSPDLTLEVPS